MDASGAVLLRAGRVPLLQPTCPEAGTAQTKTLPEGRETDADSGGSPDGGARSGVASREAELETELSRANVENAELKDEVRTMKEQLEREKVKYKELWKLSCEQLREQDETIALKEEEVESLKGLIGRLEAGAPKPEESS